MVDEPLDIEVKDIRDGNATPMKSKRNYKHGYNSKWKNGYITPEKKTNCMVWALNKHARR